MRSTCASDQIIKKSNKKKNAATFARKKIVSSRGASRKLCSKRRDISPPARRDCRVAERSATTARRRLRPSEKLLLAADGVQGPRSLNAARRFERRRTRVFVRRPAGTVKEAADGGFFVMRTNGMRSLKHNEERKVMFSNCAQRQMFSFVDQTLF